MIFPGDRIRKFDGTTYVVVQEPLTKAHRRLLDRHHAVQVDEMDPPSPDLDWLTPWAATLERLLVTDRSVTDISALASFSNLDTLELFTGTVKGQKNRLDLDAFSRLRTFSSFWFTVHDRLFANRTVENLLLERPPADVLSRCAEMPALRALRLAGAKKVTEIERLPAPSPIRRLKVSLGRFTDVSGLASYPNLEVLELDDCRGVRDLSGMRGMSRLRRLVLEDCGEIETLSFLGDIPIEELFLIGSTNILDGDLRSVGGGLRAVSFPTRSHYNATPKDLK